MVSSLLLSQAVHHVSTVHTHMLAVAHVQGRCGNPQPGTKRRCPELPPSLSHRYMISSGFPATEYIDSAVRHVLLRQGVLGIKVRREPSLPPSLSHPEEAVCSAAALDNAAPRLKAAARWGLGVKWSGCRRSWNVGCRRSAGQPPAPLGNRR